VCGAIRQNIQDSLYGLWGGDCPETGSYRSLNKLLDEFRLLAVYPGAPDALIRCKLDTLPLGDYSRHAEGVYKWSDGTVHDSHWQPDASSNGAGQWAPQYEALSYTWGDPTDKLSIEVNGSTIQVTTNLFSALLALRKPNEDRILWIDALYIKSRRHPGAERTGSAHAIYLSAGTADDSMAR
jgi:hypothetical protein